MTIIPVVMINYTARKEYRKQHSKINNESTINNTAYYLNSQCAVNNVVNYTTNSQRINNAANDATSIR